MTLIPRRPFSRDAGTSLIGAALLRLFGCGTPTSTRRLSALVGGASLVLALTAATPNAFAGEDQVPTDREIVLLHAYDSGAFVIVSPSFNHTQSCGGNNPDNTVYIGFDLGDNRGKAMYATAMMAFSLSKPIGFGINGCQGNLVRAYRLDIAK